MWIRILIALLALVAAAAAGSPTRAGAASDKTRIVLIWTPPDHPYGSHMYEFECRLLAKCLNQTAGVDAVVSPDPEWPKDESILDHARGIVFYSRQAGDIVLSPAHRDRFRALLKDKAGFVAIHWATKAEDTSLIPAYLDVLGGAFHALPGWALKTDTRPLIQSDATHPICRGWKPFELHEEWYLGLKFHEKAHPVISVNVDGHEQVVAWTFDRMDGGRSFGATLGHFHENFALEPFRRALVNGILWSAGVEIPEAGAPVALTPDDLKLPPDPAGTK
jgi:type 1 glutamine amidotransferase